MTQQSLWMVVRLVECRLMFLNSTGAFDVLGENTFVAPDREQAFQLGRKVNGLLMRADGLPNAVAIERFAGDCFQAFGVNITGECVAA